MAFLALASKRAWKERGTTQNFFAGSADECFLRRSAFSLYFALELYDRRTEACIFRNKIEGWRGHVGVMVTFRVIRTQYDKVESSLLSLLAIHCGVVY